jgi:hypothetical protein
MSFQLLLSLLDLIMINEESSGLILNTKMEEEELMSKVVYCINVRET